MQKLEIFKVNAPLEEVRESIHKHCEVTDETKQAIVEETAGAMSASGVLWMVTLTAGGIALMADPIAGTIIIVGSIVCGSVMKVWSGRYFKRHFRKTVEPENIDATNLEENLVRVLKESPVIRTGTSNYGFIRLLSKGGLSPTLVYSKTIKEMFSPQASPVTSPKGRFLPKLTFSPQTSPATSPKGRFLPKLTFSPQTSPQTSPRTKIQNLLKVKGLMAQKRRVSPQLEPIKVRPSCSSISED